MKYNSSLKLGSSLYKSIFDTIKLINFCSKRNKNPLHTETFPSYFLKVKSLKTNEFKMRKIFVVPLALFEKHNLYIKVIAPVITTAKIMPSF